MKLVMRADDYGYTEEFNRGTIEAVRNGIITAVDLMLDTQGSIDAMERIKEFPWISVGWHGGHFWGTPVADSSLIPSLLDKNGRFKFRVDQELKQNVVYEEALIECRAQIERCIKALGKAPDSADVGAESTFELARRQVCDEYGIPHNFMRKMNRKTRIMAQPSEKYKNFNIYMPMQHESGYKILYSDYAEEREKYDPVKYYIEDQDNLLKEAIVITAWHPGYLDNYVYFDSSKHFNLARVIDIGAMCSPVLKHWIVENGVELLNIRDALLGTNEYQNHLKTINSNLYVNYK